VRIPIDVEAIEIGLGIGKLKLRTKASIAPIITQHTADKPTRVGIKRYVTADIGMTIKPGPRICRDLAAVI
jgi:hypothetical protein